MESRKKHTVQFFLNSRPPSVRLMRPLEDSQHFCPGDLFRGDTMLKEGRTANPVSRRYKRSKRQNAPSSPVEK